jgi:KipI family sensor histidine kinase inhibitor
VLVTFRHAVPAASHLGEVIERAAAAPASASPGTLTIAVQYDGADLDAIAATVGLAKEQVVQRHIEAVYTVAFMGFAPGFGYLTGLDPGLHLPRLPEPRVRVPAGSVAIAGPYTAIYPGQYPGGWHILGTTGVELFNARSDPPALLAAGMTVRFRRA